MKKALVLGILGLTAAATQSFGQGQIIFANYYSSTQTTGVTYGTGSPAGILGKGVGPEISAILLWGASGSATAGNVTPLSSIPFGLGAASGPGAIGTGAGWFSAGKVTINGGVAGNYAFQIEATGTNNGVLYQGFSPVVTGPTTASSSSPVPNLPNSLWKGSFTVTPTPEPSILALSGIGAAALMLVRRKK